MPFADWRFGENFPCSTGHFDVALCLYDSLNYAKNWQEVDQLVSEVARILKPNGIFFS